MKKIIVITSCILFLLRVEAQTENNGKANAKYARLLDKQLMKGYAGSDTLSAFYFLLSRIDSSGHIAEVRTYPSTGYKLEAIILQRAKTDTITWEKGKPHYILTPLYFMAFDKGKQQYSSIPVSELFFNRASNIRFPADLPVIVANPVTMITFFNGNHPRY